MRTKAALVFAVALTALTLPFASTASANLNAPTSSCDFAPSQDPFMTSSPHRIASRIPSVGKVAAIAIPVDFPEARGVKSELITQRRNLDALQSYFAKQSAGKLELSIEQFPQWVNTSINFSQFKLASAQPDNSRYVDALIAAVNPTVDLSKYSLVYFIVPQQVSMAQIARGSAVLTEHAITGGVISNFIITGGDVNFNVSEGVPEAYVRYLAHETGHTLGLYDEDFQHQRPTLGPWNIMANVWGDGLYGFSAWDRYIQGWLQPGTYKCLNVKDLKRRLTISIVSDSGLQALFIRKSSTEVIVIEHVLPPRRAGSSSLRDQALVYSVNLSKGQAEGGYVVIPRHGFQDPEFSDTALSVGDFASTADIRVLAGRYVNSGLVMTISRI